MLRSFRKRSRYRSSEQGFSLLASLLIGLLMLLVTMTTMFRSQNDRAIAYAQELSSRSLTLAEAGAATYQAFVLKYPILATYSDCVNRGVGGSCNDSGTTQSWANAQSINGAAGCNDSSASLTTSDLSQIETIATTELQDLDPADPAQGQFRLVDYQYQPDPGVSPNAVPGTGTLRVEGQVRPSGNASSQGATTQKNSIARVAISFRVNAPSKQTGSLDGLWSSSFSMSGGGTNRIKANVCDASGTNSSAGLQSYMGNLPSPPYPAGQMSQIHYTSQPYPSLPTIGENPLTGSDANTVPAITLSGNTTACRLPMLGVVQAGCPISPPFNEASIGSVYRYNIASITIKSGATLKLGKTGNETIMLYLPGTLELNGGGFLEIQPGTKVIFYIHGAITESGGSMINHTGQPENLQIYKYGTDKITLSGGSSKNAFVYAPQASADMSSSSGITGAIWVNTWKASGSSSISAGITNPSALQVEVSGGGRSKISPATLWQQQNAQ
jgi:Tfp pilus assembly protein PilX